MRNTSSAQCLTESQTRPTILASHYTGLTPSHTIKSTLKALTTLYLIKVSCHLSMCPPPPSSLSSVTARLYLRSVIHSSSSASLPPGLLIDRPQGPPSQSDRTNPLAWPSDTLTWKPVVRLIGRLLMLQCPSQLDWTLGWHSV